MSDNKKQTSIGDQLFAWLQYVLPQHLLSRIMLALTRIRVRWLKNFIIKQYIRILDVDLAEAEITDYTQYESVNNFFTRSLKPEARPIAASPHVTCPVDGTISEIGYIQDEQLFQAKGHTYTLEDLLGGSLERASYFRNGSFATLYLSPKDYHRIHMPAQGKLIEMIHIPGCLFSVSPATTRAIPNLFARNERVIASFRSTYGPMGMVMVGAIFVGSIETIWAGVVTPPAGRHMRQWSYETSTPITIERGKEMGRFNMGSTIILLFAENKVRWDEALCSGSKIKMGQSLGTFVQGNTG